MHISIERNDEDFGACPAGPMSLVPVTKPGGSSSSTSSSGAVMLTEAETEA